MIGEVMSDKKDLTLRLLCDCHDERCFIYFCLLWWNKLDLYPMLEINLEYSNLKWKRRIADIWKLLIGGIYKKEADVELVGFDKIRQLRDFLNTCLEQESVMCDMDSEKTGDR